MTAVLRRAATTAAPRNLDHPHLPVAHAPPTDRQRRTTRAESLRRPETPRSARPHHWQPAGPISRRRDVAPYWLVPGAQQREESAPLPGAPNGSCTKHCPCPRRCERAELSKPRNLAPPRRHLAVTRSASLCVTAGGCPRPGAVSDARLQGFVDPMLRHSCRPMVAAAVRSQARTLALRAGYREVRSRPEGPPTAPPPADFAIPNSRQRRSGPVIGRMLSASPKTPFVVTPSAPGFPSANGPPLGDRTDR